MFRLGAMWVVLFRGMAAAWRELRRTISAACDVFGI